MAVKKGSTTKARVEDRPTASEILEAALALGDRRGWSATSMAEVARDLGCGLSDIKRHYRDKDALADAWFEEAMMAMLAPTGDSFSQLSPEDRLAERLATWFGALSRHGKTSREMLSAKLYLGHLHHWGPLPFTLSRFVHWLLDASEIYSQGRRRQLEEIGLSTLVLATLLLWLRNPGQDDARILAFLRKNLNRGGRLLGCLPTAWGQ